MEARDKVLYGKERRSLEIDENEKKTTAYHESGHAIVGLIVKHADPVDKVTIIPRGMSLGATMFLPKKNRVSYWRNELHRPVSCFDGRSVVPKRFLFGMFPAGRDKISNGRHRLLAVWFASGG